MTTLLPDNSEPGQDTVTGVPWGTGSRVSADTPVEPSGSATQTGKYGV